MSENWQARAAKYAQNHNLSHPVGVYALDLISELGEVAKEILLTTAYGERPFSPANATNNQRLAAELGDALYSLCMLANSANVDLEAAFTAALQKYEARWRASGRLGSEPETNGDGE